MRYGDPPPAVWKNEPVFLSRCHGCVLQWGAVLCRSDSGLSAGGGNGRFQLSGKGWWKGEKCTVNSRRRSFAQRQHSHHQPRCVVHVRKRLPVLFCFQGVAAVACLGRWGELVCSCCSEEQPTEVKLAAATVLVRCTRSVLSSPQLPLGECCEWAWKY